MDHDLVLVRLAIMRYLLCTYLLGAFSMGHGSPLFSKKLGDITPKADPFHPNFTPCSGAISPQQLELQTSTAPCSKE